MEGSGEERGKRGKNGRQQRVMEDKGRNGGQQVGMAGEWRIG